MKKIAIVVCLAMLLGMLVGCVSDKAYVPSGDGLADQTKPTQPEQTQPEGEDQEQSEFTLAYYPKEGFNPYLCTSFNNRMLFSLLYQSLFVMNSSYEVEPQLCSAVTVSEDLSVYTIELEPAVFSDGTPLTAEDVVASLQYARESDYFRGRFDQISEVTLVNERTIRVASYVSYENLPMLLTIPIVKKDTLEQEMPIGSGPYRVEKTQSGMVLRRNTGWWCHVELPITNDLITLRAFNNPAGIRDAFEFEDVGLATADPGAATYAEYRCDYELWEEETGIFLYLATNASSPVFSNPEIRSALAFAVDRAGILEEHYKGFGMIATLPASPGSPFYHRGLASKIKYDPSKLKSAIINAGMVGQEVTLCVNNSDTVRLQVARRIAKELTGCGLVVTVVDNSTSYFRERLLAGNFDLYLGQTKLSSSMDLSEFFAPYGALSYGGMDDSVLYTLCLNALENSGNFYNLHQMVMEDGQLIPILFRTYAVYGKRGLAQSLSPGRDNIFYYPMGKTMDDVVTFQTSEE